MPRDGSEIYYIPPGTEGIPDSTIESIKYNEFIHDVEQDLNHPRPIVAGGTGGSTEEEALFNLSGEMAYQVVTNFDTHPYIPGSFYADAVATAPPVAGHAFAGIIYQANLAGDMVVEARDLTDAAYPIYSRTKVGGAWSAWIKQATFADIKTYVDAQDALKVAKAGDTMTGPLILNADPSDVLGAATKQYVDATATSGGMAVLYDTVQTLTAPQQQQARQNIYAAPFDAMAYSGLQINGAMEVSQENGTTAIALANTTKYIVDGFAATLLGVGSGFGTQVPITSLPGFPACLAFQCNVINTLAGANDAQSIYQNIEGYRWSRLGFATANAQPVTIGFWVNPHVSGTMAVAVRGGGARSYIVEVPIVTGWNYKTVTIPGDVAGTWNTTSGIGATITFCFGAGSGRKAAANTWVAVDAQATAATTNFFATTGTIYFTGVTVLPGNEAPSAARSPFVMRPYDQELSICRRYLWRRNTVAANQIIGTLQAYSATLASGALFRLRPDMRSAPTVSISSVAHFGAYTPGGGPIIASSLVFGSSADDVWLGTSTFATGLVAGNAAVFFANNAAAWIQMDARL